MASLTNWTEKYGSRRLSYWERLVLSVLKTGPIPRHVAFIMDGNRRWARQRNVANQNGHIQGYSSFVFAHQFCTELGISEISFYAFSIENFKRSKEEVDHLMNILKEILEYSLKFDMEYNMNYGICWNYFGNMNLLNDEMKHLITDLRLKTINNKKVIINVGIAYTARDEITNSLQDIRQGVRDGLIDLEDVSEELITSCLYVKNPVDMLIRTSGEMRLSDFLLWQTTNTQFYILDKLWPDVTAWDFFIQILKYQRAYKLCSSIKYEEKNNIFNPKIMKFVDEVRKKRLQTMKSYLKA